MLATAQMGKRQTPLEAIVELIQKINRADHMRSSSGVMTSSAAEQETKKILRSLRSDLVANSMGKSSSFSELLNAVFAKTQFTNPWERTDNPTWVPRAYSVVKVILEKIKDDSDKLLLIELCRERATRYDETYGTNRLEVLNTTLQPVLDAIAQREAERKSAEERRERAALVGRRIQLVTETLTQFRQQVFDIFAEKTQVFYLRGNKSILLGIAFTLAQAALIEDEEFLLRDEFTQDGQVKFILDSVMQKESVEHQGKRRSIDAIIRARRGFFSSTFKYDTGKPTASMEKFNDAVQAVEAYKTFAL